MTRWCFATTVLDDIKLLARREGCTPFMTLLAVLKALLHHDTGAADIVIGAYVENRSRPEFAGLLGFSNFLVLRTNLSGDPTFRELLQRVRETTLAAYAHQDLPYEELCRGLQQHGRQAPAVQVTFAGIDAPSSALKLPGLEVRRVPFVAPESMPWGLSFNVHAYQKNDCVVSMDTDKYDPAGVLRMMPAL